MVELGSVNMPINAPKTSADNDLEQFFRVLNFLSRSVFYLVDYKGGSPYLRDIKGILINK